MSLMSLRESLSRSKAKWKNRLFNSRDSTNSAISSTHDISDRSAQSSKAWSGCKALLNMLESNTEVFGPLKSAIGALNTCIEAGERAYMEHKEYIELTERLGELLDDLAMHMANPMGPLMTNSVKRLCGELEAEVKSVEEKQARGTGRKILKAMDTSDDVMACYRRIHGHLERLTLNANLSMLDANTQMFDANTRMLQAFDERTAETRLTAMLPSMSAAYNSAAKHEIGRVGCTPGTRESQIALLLDWASDPDAGRTCWVNGMAGTGKTTIAYTVCTDLDNACQLGASFFCSRTIPECRQVKYIIPSVAYQLARFSFPFRCALVEVLESDPDAHTRALSIQYEKLIVGPVSKVNGSLPTDFIVMIDALDECENENSFRMQALLETVICALEPMTPDGLAGLLDMGRAQEVYALTQPLRSVLNVSEASGLVTTLHASFPDFMLSADRAGLFYCEGTTRHGEMAKGCLRIIDGVEPKFNICGLDSSCLLDDEVKDLNQRVNRAISPGLIYACQYWSTHLSLGESPDELVDRVHSFFFSRLLIWLEILNLTKRKRYGTSIIQEAEKWCSKYAPSSDVAKLAHDAWQFISVFASNPVSQSTPHIYVTMLPFWPTSRPISKAYMPRCVSMIQPTGTAITRRRLSLLATWHLASARMENYSMSVPVDGTRLATATVEGIVVLDTITGEDIHSLSEPEVVLSVALSPDGSITFSCRSGAITFGCRSGTIKHWDPRDGGQVTELVPSQVFDSNITSVTISPDQGRVAIGLQGGEIYIYSLRSKERLHGPLKGHTDYVFPVVFSPDGSCLASGSGDNTVRIWDTSTGHMVGNTLEGHTDEVNSLSYSLDGSRLASASRDRTVRVWDPQTGQTVLGPLEGHSDGVLSVDFSPDGRFIASGSFDNTILIYDAQTGQKVLGLLQGHTHRVYSVNFSPDSSRLFSRSSDGTIRVWYMQVLDADDALLPSSPLFSTIPCARYSHSGSRVVSGSKDGTIHVWDVQTGSMALGPLQGHTSWISSVDCSPNDAYFVSASYDCTLRIWDASNGNDTHGPIKGHTKAVNCVRFSPGSSVLASGSDDGTVRTWDVSSGQQVMTSLEGDDPIYSIGFSPDGWQLVTGSKNGTLQVLDRHTGAVAIGPVQAHSHKISSVEFSSDGQKVLSSSWDDTIQIWDVQAGQQTVTRRGHPFKHNNRVNSASFSSDGRLIVSGCADRTVHVWDVETGMLILGPLEGHTSWVRCVQFSPDGSHVVSCSDDGTIRFWDVSSCRHQPQGSLGRDAGNTDAPTDSLDNTPGSWSLDEDGWVVDRQNRRLVWVPSDLRNVPLVIPLNDRIITDQGWLKLEFDGLLIGERWNECYQP